MKNSLDAVSEPLDDSSTNGFTMSWSCMTDYILIQIFDCLPPSELCLKVSLVCRHWNDVSQGTDF